MSSEIVNLPIADHSCKRLAGHKQDDAVTFIDSSYTLRWGWSVNRLVAGLYLKLEVVSCVVHSKVNLQSVMLSKCGLRIQRMRDN